MSTVRPWVAWLVWAPRSRGLAHHSESPLVLDSGEPLPPPQQAGRPHNPFPCTEHAVLAHGAPKPTIGTQVPVVAHHQVVAMFDQHRTHLRHRRLVATADLAVRQVRISGGRMSLALGWGVPGGRASHLLLVD